jgi:hypothetical protein
LLQSIANHFIFVPDRSEGPKPDRFGLDYRDLTLSTPDGVRINAWRVFPSQADPLARMLFLHGNSGNLTEFTDKISGLVRLGLDVLAVDYRGFGRSEGKPTEAGVYLDAEAGYRYWLDEGARPEELVLFGYSLGGAAAVELARRRPAAGLIVESSFTSIKDMARRLYPLAPRFFLPDMLDSLSKVPDLTLPALFIHGDRDETVPFGQGRRLYESYGGPKEWLPVAGAGHTDVETVGGPEYRRRLTDFITRNVGRP